MGVWVVSFLKKVSQEFVTYEILGVFSSEASAKEYAEEVAPELEEYYGNVEIDIEEFEVD